MGEVINAQLESYNRTIVWTLTSLVGCALLIYLYFLGVTIISIIGSDHATVQGEKIKSGLAVKEQTYVNLGRMITPQLAKSLGFVEVVVPKYVVSVETKQSFTMREER